MPRHYWRITLVQTFTSIIKGFLNVGKISNVSYKQASVVIYNARAVPNYKCATLGSVVGKLRL